MNTKKFDYNKAGKQPKNILHIENLLDTKVASIATHRMEVTVPTTMRDL